ncbi:MAG: hypothetical protein JWN67_2221 [Actinomycetia bacterium]|nr:hypothetical protein [Actinomycetes bacterium]
MFATWFRLRERCPRCAAHLEREPGFFLGAYFLNFCLMQAVLGTWIVVAFALTLPDPPMPLILGVAIAICVVLPIVGYPFSKTTWAAIHLAMAPLEPDEEADAAVYRFERGDADGEPDP